MSGQIMIPRLWVDQLTFSDGSTVQLGKSDIVVIVGPNNAGKSAALRAIRDKLSSNLKSPVVGDLSLGKEGTGDDVAEWLDTFTRKNEPLATDPVFQAFGVGVHGSQARGYWQQGGTLLHTLSRFFCHLLTADERLQAANPAQSIAVVREPPVHPTHYLIRDDKLEQRLSNQFRKAFGVDLVVNRVAGSQIPLHVGQRPIPAPGQDRLSYVRISAIADSRFRLIADSVSA
jgi:ABC-type cobalamin/Fe3+-siderophores transport system ATPase subunit